jgi:hypothetical protein
MATSNVSDTSNIVQECSICLNPLSEKGLDIFTTACQHQFHFQCLAKNVLARNNECPLCRTHLESLVNILNASSNIITPVPIENEPVQQPAPIQTMSIQQITPIQTAPSTNSTGAWGTLTKSLRNLFSCTSSSSNMSTSSANRNNGASKSNVSN